MEYRKILNLLNDENDCKFATRKWSILNDNWKANSGVGNETTYYKKVLKSILCDYNND